MLKRFIIIFNLIFFYNLIILADNLYYIGFLGNSVTAVTDLLYKGLELSLSIKDENNINSEIKPVFFNEDNENVLEDIKNTKNLLALICAFNEKHRKIIQEINDIPLISISKDFIEFNYLNKQNVFRVCPSEVQLAQDLARFSVSILDRRHYAIIYSEGVVDFLKVAEAFSEIVKKNGAKVDYFRSVEATRNDFTNILLRLRDLKIQVIFFVGPLDQAVNLTKQSYEMKTGALFMSTSIIGNKYFIKKLKNATEKSCYADISPENLYKLKKFIPFLNEYYKIEKNIDKHLIYLYDAVSMIKFCYNKGLKDKENLLKCMKEISFDGVTGKIVFDENGLRKQPPSYFYVIIKNEILQRKLMGNEIKKFMEAK